MKKMAAKSIYVKNTIEILSQMNRPMTLSVLGFIRFAPNLSPLSQNYFLIMGKFKKIQENSGKMNKKK